MRIKLASGAGGLQWLVRGRVPRAKDATTPPEALSHSGYAVALYSSICGGAASQTFLTFLQAHCSIFTTKRHTTLHPTTSLHHQRPLLLQNTAYSPPWLSFRSKSPKISLSSPRLPGLQLTTLNSRKPGPPRKNVAVRALWIFILTFASASS